jgi:transcriptional regulator GlxA family with amidase domain
MTKNPRNGPSARLGTVRQSQPQLHSVPIHPPSPPGRRVLFVLWDSVRMLDVAGPVDVFGTADPSSTLYRIHTASVGGRDVTTYRGPDLRVDLALEDVDADDVDTIIVAGGQYYAAAAADPVLIAEVRRLAAKSRRVTSVCTGAFVLAAAGLLDGRRATTHWASCADMAASYPGIVVDEDAIFVRDGRTATSAGVTAGIDLALALVEEDLGIEVTRRVAKRLVVFMQRPGGQSQFSVRAQVTNPRNEHLRRVLDAVAANPAGEHSRATMAEVASMSVRNFTRVFTEEVGVPPAQFVERARVEAAKALLELGDDGLAVIADRAGFRSEETMRRAFLRVLGIPPGAYRSRFGRPVRHREPEPALARLVEDAGR